MTPGTWAASDTTGPSSLKMLRRLPRNTLLDQMVGLMPAAEICALQCARMWASICWKVATPLDLT